jgi:hypothetical protein
MLLPKEKLLQHRANTFRTAPGSRVATLDQAVEFINQRGFAFFYPIKNVVLPSLWVAVAGDRPVPSKHDDPGHVTWSWKDNMLGKRRWYYGRVLRKRNMFISLDLLPSFSALSPNYGDYNEDYLIDYEEGRLTQEAKQVYEALLKEGPLDSIALRKAARLTGSASAFTRGLDDLQITFRAMPVGVSEAGAWHYSFIYDIVARHYPDIEERARPISEYQARRNLITCHLNSTGAATKKDIMRLFGWDASTVDHELQKLEEGGQIGLAVTIEDLPGADWVVPSALIE